MAKIKSTKGLYPPPEPMKRPVGVIFFISLHLIGLIGTPWYVMRYGASTSELALFWTWLICTSMAITVGYHRLFSHVTFKTQNWIRFLLLFFGAATFEQSALKWSSQHRQHHQFSDTEKDPYNINRGFFYSHMGWILFHKHRTLCVVPYPFRSK